MSRSSLCGFIFLCGALPGLGQTGQEEAQPVLTGGVFSYTVTPGDYLEKIGARFGVSALVLAKDNGIADPALIRPGQTLQIDNHHIVPESLQDGIVINIPQRMLFFFQDGKLAASYPVGVGRASWPTVQGTFHIAKLEQNPIWLVPKSIQEERAREGRIVESRVPPGPDNPLGEFWIGLDAPGYGIHGTIAPASVYHFQSHGCIRLHPDDITALFPRVSKGLIVKVVHVPLLIAEQGGQVFIEVDPDVYHKAPAPFEALRRLAAAQQLTARIDWQRAEELSQQQDGVARAISLVEGKESKQ